MHFYKVQIKIRDLKLRAFSRDRFGRARIHLRTGFDGSGASLTHHLGWLANIFPSATPAFIIIDNLHGIIKYKLYFT